METSWSIRKLFNRCRVYSRGRFQPEQGAPTVIFKVQYYLCAVSMYAPFRISCFYYYFHYDCALHRYPRLMASFPAAKNKSEHVLSLCASCSYCKNALNFSSTAFQATELLSFPVFLAWGLVGAGKGHVNLLPVQPFRHG